MVAYGKFKYGLTPAGGATGLLPTELWPLHGRSGRHQPDLWQGQGHVLWTPPPTVRARRQVYTATDGEYFMFSHSLPPQSEQDDKCTQQQMVSTSCYHLHYVIRWVFHVYCVQCSQWLPSIETWECQTSIQLSGWWLSSVLQKYFHILTCRNNDILVIIVV